MTKTLACATLATALLSAAGCASSGVTHPGASVHVLPSPPTSPTPSHVVDGCKFIAGGRCGGPTAISIPIYVREGEHVLHARFMCGGKLQAAETSTEVRLTWVASRVGSGAMSCAMVDLAAQLPSALGNRSVVDAVSGRTLVVRPG
jgi:hypothetical protein